MTLQKQKFEKSSDNLKDVYDKLILIRDSLKSEIENLKANRYISEDKANITNISEKESLKPMNSHKDVLENLLNCRDSNESLNNLIFSNEKIEYLQVPEDEIDVLYKKMYNADCLACKITMFHIEIIINGSLNMIETVQSINIHFVNKEEGVEMANGLSILKKARNLNFLFSAIKQYSLLSKQRNDVVNELPEEFFKIEIEENGFYTLLAQSNKRKYFICEWSISWTPPSYNFMHSFEITILYDDEQFYDDIQSSFDALCEIVSTVTAAKQKLLLWNNILEILEKHDTIIDSILSVEN